jgi:hypothetical protein
MEYIQSVYKEKPSCFIIGVASLLILLYVLYLANKESFVVNTTECFEPDHIEMASSDTVAEPFNPEDRVFTKLGGAPSIQIVQETGQVYNAQGESFFRGENGCDIYI